MLDKIAQARRDGNMKLPDTPLELSVQIYRVFGQSEGKSPSTIEIYDRVLGRLVDPEGGLGPDVRIGDITEAELREYVVGRYGRELRFGGKPSPATNNQEVRSLRAFFNWAFKEGYTEMQLLARFRPPKIPETMIRVLSDAELNLIMDEAKGSLRNTALLSILLDSGVRATELCGIKPEDVDMEHGTIRVLGKGRKERMVPFGATTQKAILSYMHHERPADAACDRLFVARYDRPMTPTALWLIMRRLGEKTGIDRLHPHLFRHTFATRFLLAGGSSIMLKVALGHTSLTMVEHYTHLVTQQAVAAARQFSPLDAWRNR